MAKNSKKISHRCQFNYPQWSNSARISELSGNVYTATYYVFCWGQKHSYMLNVFASKPEVKGTEFHWISWKQQWVMSCFPIPIIYPDGLQLQGSRKTHSVTETLISLCQSCPTPQKSIYPCLLTLISPTCFFLTPLLLSVIQGCTCIGYTVCLMSVHKPRTWSHCCAHCESEKCIS